MIDAITNAVMPSPAVWGKHQYLEMTPSQQGIVNGRRIAANYIERSKPSNQRTGIGVISRKRWVPSQQRMVNGGDSWKLHENQQAKYFKVVEAEVEGWEKSERRCKTRESAPVSCAFI
jgi:hypothetical protein